LPDNLPAIQALGPRVWQVNGLYRHGFLIAPALLDAALALLQGDATLAEQFGLLHRAAPPQAALGGEA
jgi:glycine oxidase